MSFTYTNRLKQPSQYRMKRITFTCILHRQIPMCGNVISCVKRYIFFAKHLTCSSAKIFHGAASTFHCTTNEATGKGGDPVCLIILHLYFIAHLSCRTVALGKIFVNKFFFRRATVLQLSSPELKAQVSFSDRPLSVVCRSVNL